jgi:hypothetical protein
MCEPTVVALLADHRIRQRTASIAKASSPASRPFVLAALRALRLDPDCGCRTPKCAGNDPKNGHNDHKPALTGSAVSGMTPRT